MAIKSNITDKRPRREKFKKVITLPSGGFANRTAFPEGKITVYPWDSLIDAWLTETAQKATSEERDKLLFTVLEKVCDLNGCPLNNFVLGDVNAVLMTARSIQNQSKVEYITICPDCGHEENESITVPDELELVGAKGPDYPGSDTVTLPGCGDVIELTPLRVGDQITITTRLPEAKAKISDHVALLIAPIVSINSTQPDRIEELYEWYMALPPDDAVFLEDRTDALSPHLNQEIPQRCERCNLVYGFRLVLDREFFRSGRLGAARRALEANL